MKAVVKYAIGPKKVELRDIPEPSVERGQVKVKVEYVGICATDLHIYHDHYHHVPPVVLGHEFSGTVVEIGEGVSRLKTGDEVTCEPSASVCGECLNCKTGKPNLCLHRLSVGSGLDGGMTSYCIMPQERVHLLPSCVNLREGALVEPLACCVHGVLDAGRIKPGDLVIVSGPGVIGLLALQLTRLCGATTILIGTAKDGQRLDLGLELGADYIYSSPEELSEAVGVLSEGFGADVYIECAGHEKSLSLALETVRRGGAVLQMGLFGEAFTVDMDKLVINEVALMGRFSSNWPSWNKALKLLSQKKVDVEPLIGCVLPLESWAEAFEKTERGEVLKALLRPE